mgnify:CR=1 FL=1
MVLRSQILVSKDALPTADQRTRARREASREDLKTFYDSVLPRVEAILTQFVQRGGGLVGIGEPSARPRGMIVILCTGSLPGSAAATSAWPPS